MHYKLIEKDNKLNKFSIIVDKLEDYIASFEEEIIAWIYEHPIYSWLFVIYVCVTLYMMMN